MSAKEQAIQDIKEDLKKQNKSFLAFNLKLNPIMRRLVREQLHEQINIHPYSCPTRTNSRLIAHCSFIAVSNTVQLNDYQKYYRNGNN